MKRLRHALVTLPGLLAALWLALATPSHWQAAPAAETLSPDLSAKASSDWFFFTTEDADQAAGRAQSSESTARFEQGQLVLDGRHVTSHAIFKPRQWKDVCLGAKFRVDPSSQGVQACGFVIRATDPRTYYYVHFDRGQAILVRSSPQESWNEIKRVSGLTKPAGQWHEGQLECKGDTLTVWLNGKRLYSVRETAIASPGRIGFYAGQGLVSIKDIVVSGPSSPAQAPLEVPPPQYVHVCKNGGAGGYEAFPDICRLSDGRLMCVFYTSYTHVGVPNAQWPKGGRVSYCVSEDEGKSWSAARTLVDTPQDDRDPSITQLRNGRLICNYFNIPSGTWMVASEDAGKSWSEPRQIAKGYFASSPVRELSDGSLILGLYNEVGGKAWGAVVRSQDGGETWGPVIDIPNGGHYLDAETDVIQLADGSLLAALRGRDVMCLSKSTDIGQTWATAVSMERPGHCPYLHRAATGQLLLAHRLPETALSVSTDEGKTWARPVVMDHVIGAYPSMVNLKDGSVLAVYYEEGAGSNIRSRRFRVRGQTVQWLPPADAGLGASPFQVLEVRRIWDQAPHNAFTSLVRFHDQFFCAFREGQSHVSGDGALRVIASSDGRQWTSMVRITDPKADLRDASLCVTPDGRLMLSGAAAQHESNPAHFQTMAWFSANGRQWSEGQAIGDPDVWLWSVTWHKGTAYGIGYSTAGRHFIRLYHSKDGKRFEPLVEDLGICDYPNESSLVFTADDTCYCLLRKESPGLVGKAVPPYSQWQWKPLGVRIGGPEMIQLPDGRFVGAVRLYDGGSRTALCEIDVEKGPLTELLTLPSGGDTSYPGMVWHKGLLWVSYYASHEGKTSIYLAKVQVEPKKP